MAQLLICTQSYITHIYEHTHTQLQRYTNNHVQLPGHSYTTCKNLDLFINVV